jgi:hypothetical protein
VFEDHGRVSLTIIISGRNRADKISLGLTKTGQGARIESFYRGVPSFVVPGGSEDVLIDLGVREALKLSQQAEKSRSKL